MSDDATVTSVDPNSLRSIVERVQRLETEKKEIADQIKDVYAEGKASGLEPAVVRKVLAILKQDRDEHVEQETILSTYLNALGIDYH